MSLTQTLLAGPTAIGPGIKQAIYSVAWDSSYPTGGEPLDCTDEFTYVYGIVFAGNDTSADNTYTFNALLPAATTACTTSNTLIQVWNGGTTDAIFEEEGNATNLSAIGDMKVIVWGA
jgi:hypothetical protein